ncbi:hypothetical protein SB11R_10210 [Pseudomonas oryzihabitans]|nr:hypothetical protein SB11R_10210 [Pseudomonas psychrotolerans]
MTRELFQQQQEEEFEEALALQKSLEVAALILRGESETSAVSIVDSAHKAQADASQVEMIIDDEGFRDYIGEGMNTPVVDEKLGKPGQLRAIAKRVLEKHYS